MRSFGITFNLKTFLILIFLTVFSNEMIAQINTLSAYSRYGAGVSRTATFNGSVGLSGTGQGWRPSNYRPVVYDSLARSGATINDRNTNYINVHNPASFSNFSLTTYEVGFYSQTVRYENEDQFQQEVFANFSHIAVAFPIGKRWGGIFGIKPFSNVGYDFQRGTSVNGNSVSYVFSGSGGLNEVFVGTGVQLTNNWSVGVNAKYLFGKRLSERRVVYGTGFSNFFNTLDQRNSVYSDFNFDLGVQYFKDLEKNKRLIVGATVSPLSNVNGEGRRLIRSFEGGADFEAIKDTIFSENDISSNIDIGSKYSIGLGYENKGKWIILLDYNFVNMDNEELEPGVFSTDNHQLSFGAERFTRQAFFGSYFKRMGYRIGGHYYSSIMKIDGQDIQDFGMSFGIALPLRKSFSTLNFSVEVGERGTMNADLVREQYLNIYIGMTINDKWFIKRKYD